MRVSQLQVTGRVFIPQRCSQRQEQSWLSQFASGESFPKQACWNRVPFFDLEGYHCCALRVGPIPLTFLSFDTLYCLREVALPEVETDISGQTGHSQVQYRVFGMGFFAMPDWVLVRTVVRLVLRGAWVLPYGARGMECRVLNSGREAVRR